MRNRIFLLLLVLGCTLPAFMTHVMYVYRREICWLEFENGKEKIPDHAIKTITIPAHTPIEWEKEGKEFEFHGKMYDVISIHKTALFIILECVPDVKEDQVVFAYYQYLQKSNSKNNPTLFPKEKVLKYLPVASLFPVQDFRPIEIFFNPKTALVSTSIEVNYPPPKINNAYIPI